MNLNRIMRKLQRAIVSNGFVISLDTTQFYSEDQKRMITMYILSIKAFENTRKGWKDTRYEIDRKSTRLNSSHDQISYAVFCLNKKIVSAQTDA